MDRPLRLLTVALAVWYFAAAAYHTGLIVPAGALPPASIAETILGLVLVGAIVRLIRSAPIAYGIVLVGTLAGLAIVLARGLGGTDLAIHIVMLAGLALGLVMIWLRTPSRG